MVQLVTAAAILFYLSAIPIQLAVALQAGDQNRVGVGVSIFEPRFAQKKALLFQSGSGKPPSPKLLRYVKHLRFEEIRLRGDFGTSDAALTALLWGGVTALGASLQGATHQPIRIDLRPDFSANNFHAELSGMITLRAGHIMLAALQGALQNSAGRLKQWTSIPSRAS